MTSTMYKNSAKYFNGRKTIPIDRAVAQCLNGRETQPTGKGSGPSVFQSVSMGERHSLLTGALAPELCT